MAFRTSPVTDLYVEADGPSLYTCGTNLSLQYAVIVREPAIGLFKWLRPKSLKVCSYVENVLNSKIKLLKNRLVHKSAIRNGIPPG